VFQPDSNFTEGYADLVGFDDGTIESGLEYRDSASWQPKSWVVGVVNNGQARAYDWDDLQQYKWINDTLGGQSINLVARPPVGFEASNSTLEVIARLDGSGVDSLLTSGTIPAYQEFWHSWRTFHPNTTRYEPRR